MKKDPAENGKPKVGTFIQNFGEAFGALADRTTLGEGKYEPFDWRKRDDQYFIEKLSRHWLDFCENNDSIDEDGLPNISAVCFHALCLMWKYEKRNNEPTETTEILPNESEGPERDYRAWACSEGWEWSKIFSYWHRHVFRQTDGAMRDMHKKYLATQEATSGHGDGSSKNIAEVAIDSRGEVL